MFSLLTSLNGNFEFSWPLIYFMWKIKEEADLNENISATEW